VAQASNPDLASVKAIFFELSRANPRDARMGDRFLVGGIKRKTPDLTLQDVADL
jgi:hypothetical protein